MSAQSKYASCGLPPEDIARLEACDEAHAKWWSENSDLGWAVEVDPLSLRMAFNAGWYFCSNRDSNTNAGGER